MYYSITEQTRYAKIQHPFLTVVKITKYATVNREHSVDEPARYNVYHCFSFHAENGIASWHSKSTLKARGKKATTLKVCRNA